MKFEVAIVGCGPVGLFSALTLSRCGAKLVLYPGADDPAPWGVFWPGLADHWGLIAQSLGLPQTRALLRLFLRSRELLRDFAEASLQRGAVFQLANNLTEMQELTLGLDWLSPLWPRRLMGAAAASNLLDLDQVEGAAFVGDCSTFQPQQLREALLDELQQQGAEICRGPLPHPQQLEAEIGVFEGDVQSLREWGWQMPWLWTQSALLCHCSGVDQVCHPSLIGLESHRGHLWVFPDRGTGWWLGGMAPDEVGTGELEAHLLAMAGRQLPGFAAATVCQRLTLTLTSSGDGLPLVGPCWGGRGWLASGLSSRAWSLGPALGEQIAHKILGPDATDGGPELLRDLPCLNPRRFWPRY